MLMRVAKDTARGARLKPSTELLLLMLFDWLLEVLHTPKGSIVTKYNVCHMLKHSQGIYMPV